MTRSLRGRVLILLAVTLMAAFVPEGEAQTLPSGWTLRNIGSGVLAGRATYSSGTYTVEGAGDNIGGSADQFSWVSQQIAGDVTIVTRVASLENTNSWAKAGLMIRETQTAGSRHAFLFVTPSNGLGFRWRSTTGGSSTSTAAVGGSAPVWLKLERRSSSFAAFRSADGVTWTRIGTATISMASTVSVGLAVTSRVPTTLATGRFGTVQVTRPLPTGWSAADVGAPAIRGSASYIGSTFSVRSAGSVIWGTSDQFTFAYRQVTGDVDLIARVASLDYVDDWSKAGVMIRASLRRDAAHASMFASAAHGLVFHRRPAAGLPSLHTHAASGSAPVWLKLERRGSAVTAFRSADGVTWRMVGSETLSLPSTFYVGLAVASYDTSRTAIATFTNVSVRAAQTSTNTRPTVGLTAPTSGAVFVAPASIAISAAAADLNGSIARVQFYRGTTLIGTDTTSPYSISWTSVPAGSYSLTAVAVDNSGATTTSAARTIFVNNPGPPRTAVFNPSADHSTSRVTYYRVEVFTAGVNPATTSAIAVQSVGKPAVVNGECRADIATLTTGLPSGSYFAAIRAVGPSGVSPRALSGVFRR